MFNTFLILIKFCFYSCSEDIGDTICTHLYQSYGNTKLTLIEANPGPCMITQHILKKTDYNILLYENNIASNTFLTVSS